MKNVLITTAHKGIFLGQVPEGKDLTTKQLTGIKNARLVINFRNGKGFMGVAQDGPHDCLLGSTGDIEVLHDVTGVFAVTDVAAAQIWE
jgi:hypothetical protein